MPVATIVQGPTVSWDYEAYWPFPQAADTFPKNLGGGAYRYMRKGAIQVTGSGMQTNQGGFYANAGGQVWNAQGPPFQTFTNVGMGGNGNMSGSWLDSFIGFPDTGNAANTMNAGCNRMSAHKGYWFSILMRSRTSATPTNKNSILLCPTNLLATWGSPIPLLGGMNRGGVGFFGDGAGQFRYVSWDRSAPATIREVIVLPAHNVQQWNKAEFFIFSARPGVAASLEILWNGTLIATRNWLGGLLEDYAANEWNWCPYIQGGDANEMDYAEAHTRMGAYDRAGVPIP